jgi:hypothetical protein
MFWILKKHKPLEKEQSVRLAIALAETSLKYIPEIEQKPKLAIEAAKNWLENPTEENTDAYVARAADAAARAADTDAYVTALAADAA